ncbi:MAG TPA: helical backbone metal receptor [Gemmatimonadaceae bacterium]|nr:helical backbone metal receptor [Gemmatimonadaceae bacterium]
MATARLIRVIVHGHCDLWVGCPLVLLRRKSVLVLASMIALGCDAGRSGTADSASVAVERDDFGGELPRFASPPQRIVSMNPATTDLLFALHAGPRIVGRSKWDLYPDSAARVPSLGDALRPNVEAVLGARPDLVILYASVDNRPAYDRLRDAGVAVIALRIDRIEHFDHAARLLGRLTGNADAGGQVADSVQRTIARVRTATTGLNRPRVFWRIWDAPLITIGRGSFLSQLVDIAGARNVYEDIEAPSQQVTFEDVVRRDPEFILVGPEGGEVVSRDPAWRAIRAVREGRVRIVDTTLVGRPSVRLGEAAVHLAQLLHPGIELR